MQKAAQTTSIDQQRRQRLTAASSTAAIASMPMWPRRCLHEGAAQEDRADQQEHGSLVLPVGRAVAGNSAGTPPSAGCTAAASSASMPSDQHDAVHARRGQFEHGRSARRPRPGAPEPAAAAGCGPGSRGLLGQGDQAGAALVRAPRSPSMPFPGRSPASFLHRGLGQVVGPWRRPFRRSRPPRLVVGLARASSANFSSSAPTVMMMSCWALGSSSKTWLRDHQRFEHEPVGACRARWSGAWRPPRGGTRSGWWRRSWPRPARRSAWPRRSRWTAARCTDAPGRLEHHVHLAAAAADLQALGVLRLDDRVGCAMPRRRPARSS